MWCIYVHLIPLDQQDFPHVAESGNRLFIRREVEGPRHQLGDVDGTERLPREGHTIKYLMMPHGSVPITSVEDSWSEEEVPLP